MASLWRAEQESIAAAHESCPPVVKMLEEVAALLASVQQAVPEAMLVSELTFVSLASLEERSVTSD